VGSAEAAERWRLYEGKDNVVYVIVSGTIKVNAATSPMNWHCVVQASRSCPTTYLLRGQLVHLQPEWRGDPDEARDVWTGGRRLSHKAEAMISFVAGRLPALQLNAS